MPVLTQAQFKQRFPKKNYKKYLTYIKNQSKNPKMVKVATTRLKRIQGGGSGTRGGAASTGASTMGPLDVAVGRVRTLDQLRAIAAAEVDRAISQEAAPYLEATRQAQTGKKEDLADIEGMFKDILPYAKSGAESLQRFYGSTQAAVGDINEQAADRIEGIRDARAEEGMQLQETIGGQVDMGEFTGAIDVEQQAFRHQVAGDLLMTMADAQAGAQEAMSFATKVLPLVQKEEMSETRRMYDEQITGLQREVARIRSQKGSMMSERLNELVASEREWLLAKTQAERDFAIAQMSIRNERERLELERISLFGVDASGNLTLDAQKTLLAQENEAKLQAARFKERAGVLLTQITQSSTRTTTQLVPASASDPGAFQTSDGSWVKYKDIKETVGGVSSPYDIYDYLIINGIPAKIALSTVRTWLGNPGWRRGNKPGTAVTAVPAYGDPTSPMTVPDSSLYGGGLGAYG